MSISPIQKPISLIFKDQRTLDFTLATLVSSSHTLGIKEYCDSEGKGLYIEITHNNLNTQLDLTGVTPYTILQFDSKGIFTGASVSLGSPIAVFGLITQAKHILILPFDQKFPIQHVTHIKVL